MSDSLIIARNIKMMIDQFQDIHGIDNRELKFKEVLDYLLTQPVFVKTHLRFYNAVLNTIRDNQLRRHHSITGNNFIRQEVENWELINDSPIINYNHYYYLFSTL